jgi:hypothetical protein
MLPGPESQRLANYWFTLAAVAGTALERQAEEFIRCVGRQMGGGWVLECLPCCAHP